MEIGVAVIIMLLGVGAMVEDLPIIEKFTEWFIKKFVEN